MSAIKTTRNVVLAVACTSAVAAFAVRPGADGVGHARSDRDGERLPETVQFCAEVATASGDLPGPGNEPDSVEITPMILIPGGEFLMGSEAGDDSSPIHKVYVDAFYMDKHEVTNAQYFKFSQETGRMMPEFWGMDKYRSGPNYPDHPVMGINWSDAEAYAEWCGKRLPTEAEWEYAARGGLVGMKYPDGDTIDSIAANYYKSDGPVRVCSYPPNGYGLCDMAGNVVEWVSDWYDYDYYSASPDSNPKGPEKGKFRVIRGGGWRSGPGCNSVYFRNALRSSWRDFNVGFRCARDYP